MTAVRVTLEGTRVENPASVASSLTSARAHTLDSAVATGFGEFQSSLQIATEMAAELASSPASQSRPTVTPTTASQTMAL